MLNPFKLSLFSFQIWSHKVMCWLVPWFMPYTLISSLLLWPVHGIYRLVVVTQVGIYSVIAAAYMLPWLRRNTLLRIGYNFVQINVAITHATVLFLAGRRMTAWEPSKR